jgi:hypothetical protein
MDIDGAPVFAEVEFFFQLRFGEELHSLALVTMFSAPDQEVLESSSHAAYICHRGGTDTLTVVDVKAITAVVSMVPDFKVTESGDIITPDNTYSLVEMSFIKLSSFVESDDNDDVDDDGIDFVE